MSDNFQKKKIVMPVKQDPSSEEQLAVQIQQLSVKVRAANQLSRFNCFLLRRKIS